MEGENRAVPLVVDVDGTLINGDLLLENGARMLSSRPLLLPLIPWWAVTGGLVGLKRKMALATAVAPKSLLYHKSVLEEMLRAKKEGRPVWLASASDELLVAPLAFEVGAHDYCASDGKTNLLGEAKARRLVALFGEGGFDYIGNEGWDVPVWKRARRSLGIGLSTSLQRQVRQIDAKARFFPRQEEGCLGDYFKALRPHQWFKNTLVFVPLLAAQESRPTVYLMAGALGLALSLCASGSYLFNDILDLPHDRRHPSKRHRPLAKGLIGLLGAILLGFVLILVGLGGAFLLSPTAGACVLTYLAMTVAYSLWIKRQLLMDVVLLGLLFTLRVAAGGLVTGIPLTPWPLAFSLFIFLALGLVKRQKEVYLMAQSPGPEPPMSTARAWQAQDLPILASLAAASALCSIVILALYIQDPEAGIRYPDTHFLWALCPLLLYWVGRIILLAGRGTMDDDPVLFALKDKTSWAVGLLMLLLWYLAL